MATTEVPLNIRRQLRSLCTRHGLLRGEKPPPDPQPFTPLSPEDAERLIRCFLEGFFGRTAVLQPDKSYVTREDRQVVSIHPSSALYQVALKREAIMFLESVFTTKNYVKKVTAVQEAWVEEAVKRATQW